MITINPKFGDTQADYWVKAVDRAGQNSLWSNKKSTTGNGPVWKQTVTNDLPERFGMGPNYPNPFNPVTTIKYDLPENSSITLKLYNLMGQEIATLVNGNMDAGYQNVIWDGKDSHGNPVSSGMYLYRLAAVSRESDKEFHMSRKMVLIR